MECLVFLLLLVAAGVVLGLGLKSVFQGRSRRQQQPTVTIRQVTPRPDQWVEEVLVDRDGYYHFEKRGEARTYVTQSKPGEWRQILDDQPIVGTKHYAKGVANLLSTRAPWLEFEREPTNPYDRNAIKVNAVIEMGGGKQDNAHIGYLPAETAALIAEEVPPDMPITAFLTSYAPSTKDEGGASAYCGVFVGSRWCPMCKGDLGRVPRKPGKCNACGGEFDFSPKLGVVVPR